MSLESKDFNRGVANGRAKLRKEIHNYFEGGNKIHWLKKRIDKQFEMRLPKVNPLDHKYKGQLYQDIY